jgi:hypothetical protein
VTTALITRFVEGRPFDRFEIVTVDGRRIRVPHSDYASLERFAAASVIHDDEGRAEFIDTELIVSIRTLDPLAQAIQPED